MIQFWLQSMKDFHFFKTGEVILHSIVLNCGAGDDDEDDFDEGKKGQKGLGVSYTDCQ